MNGKLSAECVSLGNGIRRISSENDGTKITRNIQRKYTNRVTFTTVYTHTHTQVNGEWERLQTRTILQQCVMAHIHSQRAFHNTVLHLYGWFVLLLDAFWSVFLPVSHWNPLLFAQNQQSSPQRDEDARKKSKNKRPESVPSTLSLCLPPAKVPTILYHWVRWWRATVS